MMAKSILLVTALLSGLQTAAARRPPQMVRIMGTDYAFQLPEHVRAGETIFTFENRGSVRHEMALALLKPGFRPDSILTSVIAGSPRRNWLEGQAPLIVSRPGDQPGPGLWLDLQAGRTYLVICTLRDKPDASPHAAMGMVASFRVEQ
jgi:hypothetical protein